MANKTITQVPVARSHVLGVKFWQAEGDILCQATYITRDINGVLIARKTIDISLSAAEKTTLINFIDNSVLPDANAAEGT